MRLFIRKESRHQLMAIPNELCALRDPEPSSRLAALVSERFVDHLRTESAGHLNPQIFPYRSCRCPGGAYRFTKVLFCASQLDAPPSEFKTLTHIDLLQI